LLDRGDQRVALAESLRVPRRTITRTRNELGAARIAVQKAGAAAERGDYQAAQREVDGISKRATATIGEINKAIAAARQSRSRR
jgi:hypothetical protein